MKVSKSLLMGAALMTGIIVSAQDERAGGNRAGGDETGQGGRRASRRDGQGRMDRSQMQERMLNMIAERLKFTPEETAKFKDLSKKSQEANKAELEKLEKQIQEIRKKSQEELSTALKAVLPEAKYKAYEEMQKKFQTRGGRRGEFGNRGGRGGRTRGGNDAGAKPNNSKQDAPQSDTQE